MSQAHQAIKIQNPTLADQLLAQVCACSPVVRHALDDYGQASLARYLRQILKISQKPLQPRDDLLNVVYHYAAPLLGKSVAEQAVLELQTLPAVLTANHHGVDFMAQSVQGSLLFSLREVGHSSAKTVPIFACGNIALNNPTYPRGLLLYDAGRHAAEFKLPVRLPIFPDRDKRKSVSIVNAFDLKMIAKAQKHLALMVQNQKLNPIQAEAAARILNEDYQNNTIVGLRNYSQQSVVLNNRIWKRCFREPEQAPDLVYLELEKITSLLLQLDLNNEDSLVWQVMFNPNLRTKVLSQLDGAKACWDQGRLCNRLSQNLDSRFTVSGGSGTIFFWAIDDSGLRVPLSLIGASNHSMELQGRDEHDKLWTIPFSSCDILQGLQAGKLLPSLFTCYMTIGFARGITCCGGYFQAEYLAGMQRGLINALCEIPGCMNIVEQLSQVPSDIYLSGMQMVMRHLDDDLLLPAGPIEMIASGGLSQSQLEKHMCSITVKNAHIAGLMETLLDFQPYKDRVDGWYLILARESSYFLKNKTLII